MNKKFDARITKGIVFAGCSFTWGQGLYYYSNLPTLQEPPPDRYDHSVLRRSHIKFMEANRYPRLVANHFNTYELVHHQNGGSNEGAVNYWRNCFSNNYHEDTERTHSNLSKLSFNEVSHIVFQITQWQRDTFTFTHKADSDINSDYQSYTIPFNKTSFTPWQQMWLEYCSLNNIDGNQWIDDFIQNKVLQNIKNFLQEMESHGITTSLFTWPREMVRFIKQDSWLLDRFITFNYKDQQFDSIEHLMGEGAMYSRPSFSPELTIKWDDGMFETTPKDHHPSLKCHQVMAENVIRHIRDKVK